MKAILFLAVICLSLAPAKGQITGLDSPNNYNNNYYYSEDYTISQLTMYGQLAYQVNQDSPEFCILIKGNVNGVDSFNVDVECSCKKSFSSSFACLNGSLPFIMYAQGTRYEHMGMAEANGDTVEKTPFEARQSWHTFPTPIVNSPTEQVTNVRFVVTKNRPILSSGEFNFLQLYLKFLRPNGLRNGDWITIFVRNVKVYGRFQSPVRLPDFEVRFRLQDPSSIDEEREDGSRPLSAEGWESTPRVYDNSGVEMGVKAIYSGSDGLTMDWSGLSNGLYHLVYHTKDGLMKVKQLVVMR